MTLPGRLEWKALRRPAFWACLGLASLPPELISGLMGWQIVDPAYIALLLLWWPVDTLGRLAALHLLLAESRQGLRSPWRALAPALAAELLLALRSGVWALAGLVPGLLVLSYLGLETAAARAAVITLLLLGLLPSLFYVLQRLLAPRVLLLKPLNGAEALEASAQLLKGRLGSFLLMAAPFIAASWALDGLAMALPWGLALVLGPLSLAFLLLPLAFFRSSSSPAEAVA